MPLLTYIVEQNLQKHQVKEHQDDCLLVKIRPGSQLTFSANNDFYFFVNAFTDNGIANGRIRGTGGGNALDITPTIINTKMYKLQMFKGKVKIENFAKNLLYVELLRVTPISE